MKEIQKLSFEEELRREADAIEKELEADPDLKKLELPEDFDRKMEERLRAIEKERSVQNTGADVEKQEEQQEEYESCLSEEDREALELGKKDAGTEETSAPSDSEKGKGMASIGSIYDFGSCMWNHQCGK